MSQWSNILGLAIGAALVGWGAMRAMGFALAAARQRAGRRRAYDEGLAEFCRRVESTARAARAAKAIPDWNGWRPFRVAAIVDEARDVKSFYFTPVDGRALAAFAPGQYLTFRLPIAEGEGPLVRCYSLSERARPDYFRTTIKRVPAAGADLPPGRGSGYFHERVRVGDVLEVRAPAGTFILDLASSEPVVLVGAGIGVTPLLSMLEAIVHSGREREVYVMLGFRNSDEHPFREALARVAEVNPNVRLHVSYSSPQTSDVIYRDYNHRGRVTIERLRQVLPSNNFRFYLCGPGAMMESLVPALWQWGVPESHVHFEAFGPASVRSATDRARAGAAKRYDVQFTKSGQTATWDGSFASLLEFGEAAGVKMPAGCRAGGCGECMLAIGKGRVATLKQPGVEVPAGHCLTCISVPADELVLDA